MKSCRKTFLALAALLLGAALTGIAQDRRAPDIGYVFPAGGAQGSVFEATVGGQFLQGATHVVVSGEGVSATVIRHIKPLNQQQLGAVRKHVGHLRRSLQAAKTGKEPPPLPEDMPELPDHPWLEGLADMNLAGLDELQDTFFNPKKQLNPQLAETVELQIAIAKHAPPGDRELRIGARAGLTNPLCFQVDVLPECTEQEPGSETVIAVPMLLNGQVLPGEVDRFHLRAEEGQRLLIDARARRLIPYLADAVPGWFQAIVTLYDAEGNEVSYADDYRFHPDPFLQVQIPATGDYALEIRDAIFRGREDFVYRIAVTDASTRTTGFFPKRATLADAVAEQEPNDQWKQAEAVTFPHWSQGCIGQAGDVDLFRFEGHAGEEVVAEVFARRGMNSPVDALIKLVDNQYTTVAWNDDFMEKDGHLHLGAGLLTHHADAYLKTRLPKDGTYFIRMTDAQGHGGGEYTYQLRMSHPQPDFALRVTPSSLTVPAGQTIPVEVHVMRWDGFAEEIDLALVEPPPGFVLGGSTIPGGTDRIHVTLTAPPRKLDPPVVLRMEGQARIEGKPVRRDVVPADDTMQAFLWRHLVPAQQLLVAVSGPPGVASAITRVDSEPLRIGIGGTTEVRLNVPRRPQLDGLKWELVDAPSGVTLGEARMNGTELVLPFHATGEGVQAGTKGNLILEAIRPPRGVGKNKNQSMSLGVLPAMPFEITAGEG